MVESRQVNESRGYWTVPEQSALYPNKQQRLARLILILHLKADVKTGNAEQETLQLQIVGRKCQTSFLIEEAVASEKERIVPEDHVFTKGSKGSQHFPFFQRKAYEFTWKVQTKNSGRNPWRSLKNSPTASTASFEAANVKLATSNARNPKHQRYAGKPKIDLVGFDCDRPDTKAEICL